MLTLFKPNSKNTGCLGNFDIAFETDEKLGYNGKILLFLKLANQSSWNQQSRTGSFGASFQDPNKNAKIMFGEFEIGGIINALKHQVEFKGFHTSQSGKTSFTLKPYLDSSGNAIGMSFGVLKGNFKASLSISFAEAENVIAFLDTGLKTLYSNRIKHSATQRAEYQKSQNERPTQQRNQQQRRQPTPQRQPETPPEPEPQDEDFEQEPPAQLEEQSQDEDFTPFGS